MSALKEDIEAADYKFIQLNETTKENHRGIFELESQKNKFKAD